MDCNHVDLVESLLRSRCANREVLDAKQPYPEGGGELELLRTTRYRVRNGAVCIESLCGVERKRGRERVNPEFSGRRT